MDSVSIELWLDKRQLAALEQALTEDGTTVERTMQEQLNELYAQRVPLEQQEKIQSADEQLQYQLQARHDEFRTFKHLYSAIFIIVMLAWGALFPLVHNDIYSSLMGILWIGAWIMMGPLKKCLIIKKIDPKLDHKFPLTASRVDKDK